jgi:hypothetical protein
MATDEINLFALHFVGGRLNPEPSRAREARYYGDPARNVRFENERRGTVMTGHELHLHCEAWRQWCITRQYFIAPGAKNILARMQPAKVGQPPDAILSDDMSFFNMAVHALADMQGEDPECFVKFYWFREKNIKSIAARMGIHRDTFYARKNRFAEKAFSMAQSLKRAHLASVSVPVDAAEID